MSSKLVVSLNKRWYRKGIQVLQRVLWSDESIQRYSSGKDQKAQSLDQRAEKDWKSIQNHAEDIKGQGIPAKDVNESAEEMVNQDNASKESSPGNNN